MTSPAASGLRRQARRFLFVLVAVALLGTACGSDDGPELVAEDTVPETSSTTAAPATTTTTAPDPHRQWVAESQAVGQHEIFESPDGELKTALRNPWVGDSNLVFLVIDEPTDGWLEVYLPIRPNGSTGFVRAADVRLYQHDYRIEVRLSDFRLIAYKGDDVLLDTRVAVAADNTPTPGGLYYITELLGEFSPTNAYGTFAYGLSGYSEVHEEFNGGDGQLGIHGTNQPELIGQSVSNGCIRMTNEDIEILVRDIGLPLGVPVDIVA
jgi:lipoprotein-anchoring transpeptidase ErfK/SrfK